MRRHPRTPADTFAADDDGEQYTMPCAEAMLAGTLALMTGYAQHHDAGVRSLMARKVVSNLFFLSGHPQLSDAFRTMVLNLRARWQEDCQVVVPRAENAQTSNLETNWHSSPVSIQ